MKKIVSNFSKEEYWSESDIAQGSRDEMHALSIYPWLKGQTFHGFGGAFTESAGWCFQKLDADHQEAFLQDYFGTDGLRYRMGRTHMNSCDFSLGNYACCDHPEDTFSLQRDEQYILPLIQRANQIAGKPLELLLSPWSPPAFMKSNGQMNHGGHLLPQYRTLWAEYIAEYVKRYREAGCDVRMVSVQNEPAAVQTWDSCIYTAQEEGEFAASFLRPALDEQGAADVGILVWDHNKDILLRRACQTMEVPGAKEAVAGVAFHWYAGDHFEAVELTRQCFPDKELWFTEGCVEYSRFGASKGPEKARMYAHDILGNLRCGIAASIDWNLLLDENGGPNHVGNFCEAPIMLQAEGGYTKNPSYYAIGHFSRYIQPGAVRMASSVYDSRLESVVFCNPDGSRAAVILNGAGQDMPLWITENGTDGIQLMLEAGTLTTVVW